MTRLLLAVLGFVLSAQVLAAQTHPPVPARESFRQIQPVNVNIASVRLPVGPGMAGPSVLAAQILLDRVRFSPGVIDGHWGKNTAKAVFWFQKANGLPATGSLDAATFRLLAQKAAVPPDGRLIGIYTTGPADAADRFRRLPRDIYAQARLKELGYESAAEALGERFHSTPALLQQLNPRVDFARLGPGVRLNVPLVAAPPPANVAKLVKKIVVSAQGFYTHALDAQGRILFHYPSTLGSEYDPLPPGDWKANGVAFYPDFHFQPRLFHDVPDSNPEALVPPGPNSPVGLVWIDLSKEHYGIHGTSEPQTIGYTSSHGCVRLTNWDAWELGKYTAPGTPVTFMEGGETLPAPARRAVRPAPAPAPAAAPVPGATSAPTR
ncbi:MAG: L,D-transpeptidase family protein [Pseudomonadota bacterium]